MFITDTENPLCPHNLTPLLPLMTLSAQVEVIFVDYNSDPSLPPLQEATGLVLPPRASLPLLRIITISNSLHKVRRGSACG